MRGIVLKFGQTDRWVIAAALVVMMAMGLFPPWRVDSSNVRIAADYHFIGSSFSDDHDNPLTVDHVRLGLQWLMVAAAGAVIIILRGK